jgi:hypothetical protein
MLTVILGVLGGLVGYVLGSFSPRRRPDRYVRVQPPPMGDALPAPGESARKAAELIRELGALVERLAARDVGVYDLDCEPGARWQLIVQDGAKREKEVTRVSWRAGDPDLRVAKSVLLPNLHPNQWRDEPGIPVGPEGDTIRTAEAFILQRYAKNAGRSRSGRS